MVGRTAESGDPRRTKQIRNESTRDQRAIRTNFAACQCEARGVRSGETRISLWIHFLEPALDLRRKAVDRVLTRAPNKRGDPTFAVDEKMERRVCELGAKAPECLGTGEVGWHGRMNFGQGRADSLRLV